RDGRRRRDRDRPGGRSAPARETARARDRARDADRGELADRADEDQADLVAEPRRRPPLGARSRLADPRAPRGPSGHARRRGGVRGEARASMGCARIGGCMTFETIEIEREGHVAILSLNRPERMNAIDARMLAELPRAWAML